MEARQNNLVIPDTVNPKPNLSGPFLKIGEYLNIKGKFFKVHKLKPKQIVLKVVGRTELHKIIETMRLAQNRKAASEPKETKESFSDWKNKQPEITG